MLLHRLIRIITSIIGTIILDIALNPRIPFSSIINSKIVRITAIMIELELVISPNRILLDANIPAEVILKLTIIAHFVILLYLVNTSALNCLYEVILNTLVKCPISENKNRYNSTKTRIPK